MRKMRKQPLQSFSKLLLQFYLKCHHWYHANSLVKLRSSDGCRRRSVNYGGKYFIKVYSQVNRMCYSLERPSMFGCQWNQLVQLNKCETDPYFLQNFQCTTMFTSAYCKICELNTEREGVFAADVSGVSLKVSCKIF